MEQRLLFAQAMMKRDSMKLWGSVVALTMCASLFGCGIQSEASCEGSSCLYTVGEAEDPVMQRAQAVTIPNDSVTVTLNNSSGWDWSEGIITFSQLYTVNATASSSFRSYAAGNISATKLIQNLGLISGTNAFKVAAIKKTKTGTVTITVPANQQLYFVARVDDSIDDFVAVGPISVPTGGTLSLAGYDSDDGSRNHLTTLGNGTTGTPLTSSKMVVKNNSDCPGGMLATSSTLFTDDFSANPNNVAWPKTAGYDGDFNGDWMTDGVNARFLNPRQGGSVGITLPTMSGFVRFIDVCAGTGSTLSVTAKMTTALTDSRSDTTLVTYFYDRGGNLLNINLSNTQRDSFTSTMTAYDMAIPANTRRIAVVPVAYFAPNEDGTVFIDDLSVVYEPQNAKTSTKLAQDDFSSYGKSDFGDQQPTGWAEYGGDWYAMPDAKWATMWNPSYIGGNTGAGIQSGLYKDFAISGFTSADTLSVSVFAASTFTSTKSWAKLRVEFNTGQTLVSDPLGRGFNSLTLRRQAVPAGANSIRVYIDAFLGPNEVSSLYVDDLVISRVR